jgi:hypothetical protein
MSQLEMAPRNIVYAFSVKKSHFGLRFLDADWILSGVAFSSSPRRRAQCAVRRATFPPRPQGAAPGSASAPPAPAGAQSTQSGGQFLSPPARALRSAAGTMRFTTASTTARAAGGPLDLAEARGPPHSGRPSNATSGVSATPTRRTREAARGPLLSPATRATRSLFGRIGPADPRRTQRREPPSAAARHGYGRAEHAAPLAASRARDRALGALVRGPSFSPATRGATGRPSALRRALAGCDYSPTDVRSTLGRSWSQICKRAATRIRLARADTCAHAQSPHSRLGPGSGSYALKLPAL